MRYMGIDSGEKRIGVAITDPDGIVAYPLTIINHLAREVDANTISRLADENQVDLILIGCAFDEDGNLTPSARKSQKLADMLREKTKIPIEMVDEYGTTNIVQDAAREMKLNRQQRHSHRDDIAAVVILQRYLETQRRPHFG